MDCPKDRGALETISYQGRRMQSCPTCAGSFIAGHVVEQIPQFTHLLKAKPDVLSHLPVGTALCPEGHGSMRVFTHRNVEVDLCETCHGIWFDSGELKRIHDKQQAAGMRAQAGNESSTTQEVVEGGADLGVDVALEFLGEVAGGLFDIF